MFTDDTSLFCSNSNINELFEKVNKKLVNVIDLFFFLRKNFQLIQAKQKTFFYKQADRDNIPLKLPDLNFDNFKV